MVYDIRMYKNSLYKEYCIKLLFGMYLKHVRECHITFGIVVLYVTYQITFCLDTDSDFIRHTRRVDIEGNSVFYSVAR